MTTEKKRPNNRIISIGFRTLKDRIKHYEELTTVQTEAINNIDLYINHVVDRMDKLEKDMNRISNPLNNAVRVAVLFSLGGLVASLVLLAKVLS